jgi:hypothetical protein
VYLRQRQWVNEVLSEAVDDEKQHMYCRLVQELDAAITPAFASLPSFTAAHVTSHVGVKADRRE